MMRAGDDAAQPRGAFDHFPVDEVAHAAVRVRLCNLVVEPGAPKVCGKTNGYWLPEERELLVRPIYGNVLSSDALQRELIL